MTTGPPRPGRPRRRAAPGPRRPGDEFWATVLRRFRDHLHGARPDSTDRTESPDREDPR